MKGIGKRFEMRHIQQIALKLLLLIGLYACWANAARAQETVPATAAWSLPAGDFQVDHFIVQHSENSGPWITVGESSSMEYTFEVAVESAHRFRVASVAPDGRQSDFSEPSAELFPAGEPLDPPGAPGQPIVF